MAYENKPLLPELAAADVGDKVIAEGVTVVRELWRGGRDNGIGMYLTERDGCEGVVKVFDGSQLPIGSSITAVGKKDKHNDKYSIEVKSNTGGGIALEGEPMHSLDLTPTPQAAPPAAPTPAPVGGKRPFTEIYQTVAKSMKVIWTDEQAAAAGVHSLMIAYSRGEITEEAILRWCDRVVSGEEDIPF